MLLMHFSNFLNAVGYEKPRLCNCGLFLDGEQCQTSPLEDDQQRTKT